MYTGLVSLVNSLVNWLPFVPSAISMLISRGVSVVSIFSLFQLAGACGRYKKAAVYRTVMFVSALVAAPLRAGIVITLAGSVFSIMAVYQEYHGHGDLMESLDKRLSEKWHSLFLWGILAGLLMGFVSTAAALLIPLTQMDMVTAVAVTSFVLGIPQYILDGLYILYLRRMTVLLGEKPTAEEVP